MVCARPTALVLSLRVTVGAVVALVCAEPTAVSPLRAPVGGSVPLVRATTRLTRVTDA